MENRCITAALPFKSTALEMTENTSIIKKLIILFNVKPSPPEDTKIFKTLSNQQSELDNALEYWLDQSKMIFGEVGKIEKTHGLQEAGIDLSLNLFQSNFRFGVQIKTNSDIVEEDFSKNVLAQKSRSLRHNLSKYLICFAADMTDKSQKAKVQSIVSELSQEGDNYAITLSPEKLLTIYKVYKLNQHPLKHVFLEYSEALTLLSGVADNLNNEKIDVEIKIVMKNLEQDNISRPHKFNLGLNFDKNKTEQAKILDDLKNLPITDDVLKIDKKIVDHFKITDEVESVEDDNIRKDERILAWMNKTDRKLISFSTISISGQVIQTHDQLLDKEQDGDLITLVPKDMHDPLKVGIRTNNTLSFFEIFFTYVLNGYDAKSVFDKLNFLSSLSNATFMRIFIPEDNIITYAGQTSRNIPIIHESVLSLFRVLSALQEETGSKICLPENFVLDKNTLGSLLQIGTDLLHIAESKIVPKQNNTIEIKLRRKLGITMLTDYSNGLIKDYSMFRTNYSQTLFDTNIVILNAQLNLSHYRPITKLDESNIDDEIELSLDPVKTNQNQ